MATTSHRSAKWEVSGSALGSAPKGALGNRSALGGAPEGAQGNPGAPESAPESAQCGASQQEEHSREHSLERPGFP